MLCVVDEYTREALAIRVARRLRSHDVIDVLADLMLTRGAPEHIRSDNGAEFIAISVREWIAGVGAKTAYIEPRSLSHTLTMSPAPGDASNARLSHLNFGQARTR